MNDQNLFMPGSQSGSAILPPVSNCTNCHAGYDPVSEPHHAWQGSMMAQATRDPLWLATMTVAIQDSIWALGNPNAADLCLRCHTPTGWLGGRSDPTNATALTLNTGDFDGVSCASCHLMIDAFPGDNLQPELPAETDPTLISAAAATRAADVAILSDLKLFDGGPFFDAVTELPVNHGTATPADIMNYIEAGSGQMFVEPNDKNRRGPRNDVSTKSHTFLYSRFHKSRAMCRTCHDVSNPVLANLTYGMGTPEARSAASYFHVERTSSEFELSAYAAPGGAPAAESFASLGITTVSDCQDCHMPRVAGKFAKQGSVRTNVARHSLTGGNSWLSRVLATVDGGAAVHDPVNVALLDGTSYPGAFIETSGLQGAASSLLDGEARAIDLLQRAATLELATDTPSSAALRIVNHTGHKLISGFPEGRRMWLNVRFLDSQGQTIGEINPYQPLLVDVGTGGTPQYVSGGDLTVTRDDLVYEAKMTSALTGEEKTFHFVLATDRYKDNRIPPRGFRISEAAARLTHPRWHGEDSPDYFSAAEYAGGYDEVFLRKPTGAAGWEATLFYQTTSKPYVEFLRDEINGDASTLTLPAPSGEPIAYLAQTDPFLTTLKDWGEAIWDLWLHNGGSAPVAMTGAISPPLIEGITAGGSAAELSVVTLPGRFYQLERREDLTSGTWSQAGPIVEGDGTTRVLVDDAATAPSRCFYRVRSWKN
ncbi:MAG: hypothetical protein H7A48_00075 [Akkermansiaceae bacterium]|nr:hypothetical protein [Akkermansiaceae bacterium]